MAGSGGGFVPAEVPFTANLVDDSPLAAYEDVWEDPAAFLLLVTPVPDALASDCFSLVLEVSERESSGPRTRWGAIWRLG